MTTTTSTTTSTTTVLDPSTDERVPETWDDERDGTFFALTARLFTPDFVYGAGVLLAAL